ncbi:YrrS family protein [Alkalicoccobacillus murimartini]|uniref:Cytoskeletal protein RodZ n=1 Tax=Alkalicoccobacillus murimartini TaxID=171685 RepID=A0ABT9YE30_9BACI|nr:YrrS family protein [Alkalicoccobacillus murimartini]MDQ0205452.1 cytoskeletal protein RodZ [Alkalicoccobacillus murimartini]
MQGNRYETRKRKKMSQFLNIAIGIVVLLILFVGAQIFLNNDASDTQPQEESDNNEEVANSGGSTEVEESNEQDAVEEEDEEQGASTDGRVEDDEDPSDNEEDQTDEDETNEDAENEEDTQEEGDWEPVGTEQTGDFSPNFTEGSQNRIEMEAALQSATGISAGDMTLWRIENGGSPTTAVGTLSDSSDNSTTNSPYQVRIEWQDGEGWRAVSMDQLSSNPYR